MNDDCLLFIFAQNIFKCKLYSIEYNSCKLSMAGFVGFVGVVGAVQIKKWTYTLVWFSYTTLNGRNISFTYDNFKIYV